MSINFPINAITINNLSKTYKSQKSNSTKKALDNISLNVPQGSIFGLLGPNGAGKSTLINILSGLVRKTSGSVKIWNHNIDLEERNARLSIGVVPQELNFDPFFTPYELLEVQAGLYGLKKSNRHSMKILDALGLSEKAHVYTRTLSGGMRRRLLIAKALVHSPPILILDEPTAGVDIELRQSLWTYVKELNRMGTTIVLTTHYLEEAETLCDKIAIIDRGKLVANDDTFTLLKRLDSKSLIITLECELKEVPNGIEKFGEAILEKNELKISYKPSQTQVSEILSALQQEKLFIKDITTQETDLEDLFLKLTQASSST
jgi:ABC-2 type transport system ATP-binding protein